MTDTGTHFEPYLHLAGLTHDAALISWGGFYFRPGAHGGTAAAREATPDDTWMVVDDESLQRRDSIGERSASYGPAEVEILDERGAVVQRARVTDRNHVWVTGLSPDTEYHYRLAVNGEPWAADTHWDWLEGDQGDLAMRRSGRRYVNRFRTHPAPTAARSLAFAVLGDFGIGIRTRKPDAERQRVLARALEAAVERFDVRLVLTAGDNIYLGEEGSEATGDEDDDWFFTFYQPYRYLLNRIPFYPTVGNHDGGETEQSDDREQLDDNYFLRQRFTEEREAGRSSSDPGLFYVFKYGADVEFVCIDTTREGEGQARFFEHPKQHAFLQAAFPAAEERGPWRIPFSHHPTFCAGPHHGNTEGMAERLVPLFQRSGVRLVLAGHEHNFQYAVHHDIHYFVSGAGGKLRDEAPDAQGFERAHTAAWAAEGHFLVVEVERDTLRVHPLTVDGAGELTPLVAQTPEGEPFQGPLVIRRR